jgi:hypothetical protein
MSDTLFEQPVTDLVPSQPSVTAITNQSVEPTPLMLIQSALSAGTSPEVLRELVALQQSMERFAWESQERQAKIDFDKALTVCQEKIGRIAPNRTRENNIAWADYAELDRILRPIYTAEGFSITYSESETLREGKTLICATLSRSGQSRQFIQSVTPAGNPKMNPADLEASGQSRAQRYLLLKIFNVAIGIDADEKKGIPGNAVMDLKDYAARMEAIEGARTGREVEAAYIQALKAAKNDVEKAAFEKAALARRAELR